MSQFGAEKFTTRSREVIEAAQVSATTSGHTQTEPIIDYYRAQGLVSTIPALGSVTEVTGRAMEALQRAGAAQG